MGSAEALTIQRILEVSAVRCRRWHHEDTVAWTGADWSNAMCGEAGEVANVVKKLRRCETRTSSSIDPPLDELVAMLAHEIADVILYTLLVADHYGIDVEVAIVEKFNLVSARQGFPDRLELRSGSDAAECAWGGR